MDVFEDYYVDFHGKGENKSQAAALASAAVIRDKLERHLLTEGPFYTDKIGDPDDFENPADAFVKKPKTATLEAYTDAMREVRLGLEYEGITGKSDGSRHHEGVSALWED